MAEVSLGKPNLTPKERAFIAAYFANGFNAKQAYLTASPKSTEETASVEGCKLLARIKQKAEWKEILAHAGLDDMRLAEELNKRLNATTTEFYKGKKVAVCEDNSTRMKATELLADLLGKKKAELDLNIAKTPGLTLILEGQDGPAAPTKAE